VIIQAFAITSGAEYLIRVRLSVASAIRTVMATIRSIRGTAREGGHCRRAKSTRWDSLVAGLQFLQNEPARNEHPQPEMRQAPSCLYLNDLTAAASSSLTSKTV
jgi:hypothetical protein